MALPTVKYKLYNNTNNISLDDSTSIQHNDTMRVISKAKLSIDNNPYRTTNK